MPDREGALAELGRIGARRVLVQLPPGLKARSMEISDWLRENGIEALVSVENCFGACDLRSSEAARLGCDAVLHVGHSDLGLVSEVPVVYWEWEEELDPVPLLEKHIGGLGGFRRVALVTTVQFTGSLGKAKAFLEKQGKEVVIPSGGKQRPGQILGCDFSSAAKAGKEADCFLFIGSGAFHPLGLAMATDKPVLFLDVESGGLKDLSDEKRKETIRRGMRAEKARGCSSFGILVSTKPGQAGMKEARDAFRKLEKAGKRACMLVADEATPDKLLGLMIDCLVNTACPRIADDSGSYGVPVINHSDLPDDLAGNG